MTTISSAEYAERRRRLLHTLDKDAIALVYAAPEVYYSADRDGIYQPNPDFYYLSGFKEPHAVLAFIPNRAAGEFVMFCQNKDVHAEQWTGRRVGPEGAVQHYGANQAFTIDRLEEVLPELLANRRKIYYAFGQKPAIDQNLMAMVQRMRRQVRTGLQAPTEIANIETIVHEMRLVKSSQEIAVMQRAVDISVEAHKRAITACRTCQHEYQLQAEIEHEFKSQGGNGPAYTSIVGAGDNACILHYIDNSAALKAGDLVLIDAGCEYQYYASDLTRTFPINGRFSPEQKAIYELVLKSQLATIDLIKAGVLWHKLQDCILRVLVNGLVELGLLHGDPAELIEAQAYLPFYMHRSGHWLGLDTHDVGSYKVDGQWRPLEANMLLTVEPGLYISPGLPNVDPKWYGIGVRIEDNVVVTDTGCRVLSAALPKTIAEIEALMAN